MLVYAWACTDIGRKRSQNQDATLFAPDVRLFGVADGMGGHNGGEVASAIAVTSVEQGVRAGLAAGRDPVRALAEAVRTANARIYATGAEQPHLKGMGTTTTGVLFREGRAIVAHVGDSRVYLVRDERILQLSEDHSVVWQQMKAGLLTEEQAKRSPFRSVILRSVGVERDVDIDVIEVELKPADTFLVCSDGLSGVVSDAEILAVIGEHFLHRVPEVLVDLANERGGPDNITVVVACVVEETARVDPGSGCANPHEPLG